MGRRRVRAGARPGRRRRRLPRPAPGRRRPRGSSRSPSTMPICWWCRDDRGPHRPPHDDPPDRVVVGAPRRRRRDARRPGLAPGHGPVPRRPAHRRRPGRWRPRPASPCSPPCAAPGAGGSWRAASASTCRWAPRWPRTTARSSSTSRCPAGCVGDVHRGISHGRDDERRRPRAARRGVGALRGAGVQVVLTVVVLLVAPSPVRAAMPFVAVALVVAALGVAIAARAGRPPGRRGGRGCAAARGATCATPCSPGAPGRRSPSRRRWSSRVTRPRS